MRCAVGLPFPVLQDFRMALISKNVAADIAGQLCDSVATGLEGKKIGTFTTIKSEVKKVGPMYLCDRCICVVRCERCICVVRCAMCLCAEVCDELVW